MIARSEHGSPSDRFASGVAWAASHDIGYVLGALFGIRMGIHLDVTLPAVVRWKANQRTRTGRPWWPLQWAVRERTPGRS